MKHITAVIPCYNEESSVEAVIQGFPRERIASLGYALEVLVVDNNSSDRTASVASSAGARVIFEPRRGKGHALRRAFSELPDSTDFVVMLDGDNSYRAAEVLRLVEPLECGFAHVILGSRMYGRLGTGSMTGLNHFGNRLYSGMVRTIYSLPVTDVLTGYVAWRADVVRSLQPHLTSPGFAIEMEMITKMAKLGYSMYCVPVSYEQRLGKSSLSPVRDGAKILASLTSSLNWTPSTAVAGLASTRSMPEHRTRRRLTRVAHGSWPALVPSWAPLAVQGAVGRPRAQRLDLGPKEQPALLAPQQPGQGWTLP